MEENRVDEPERLELMIPHTQMTKSYYDAAGAIDQHNRQRHDVLELERWLRFKTFEKRVGSTILGMIIISGLNIHQSLAGEDFDKSPNVWFHKLADELIKNKADLAPVGVRTRGRQQDAEAYSASAAAASKVPVPVPSLLKKQPRNGTISNRICQRNCRICKSQCTNTCNLCSDRQSANGQTDYEQHHSCAPSSGCDCWAKYIAQHHTS